MKNIPAKTAGFRVTFVGALQGRSDNPEIPTADEQAADPYKGWTGEEAHPDAPIGGGGPGFFRAGTQPGVETDLTDPSPDPRSPSVRFVDPKSTADDATPLADLPPQPAPVVKADSVENIGGINVTIKRDQHNVAGVTGAETRLKLLSAAPGYDHYDGKVTKVKGSATITGTIATKYQSGFAPNDLSAYGRGTTKDDKAAGNVSLGFHEHCHREDLKNYLKNYSLPTFKGNKGDAISDFQQAQSDFGAAVAKYMEDATQYSDDLTDEVGKPKKSEYLSSP